MVLAVSVEQVVRCGYNSNSPRLDDLQIGQEIEVLESRVNPVTNALRVRLNMVDRLDAQGTTEADCIPYVVEL